MSSLRTGRGTLLGVALGRLCAWVPSRCRRSREFACSTLLPLRVCVLTCTKTSRVSWVQRVRGRSLGEVHLDRAAMLSPNPAAGRATPSLSQSVPGDRSAG